MADAYLGLGTNLGDKEQNLHRAIDEIAKQVGRVSARSAFYVTAPWGFSSPHSFLNAVLCVQTTLQPLELLRTTQAIERQLGRTQKSAGRQYADRLIDIDLLLYDDRVLSATIPEGATLTLPHPLLAERDFVLRPLAEIAPHVIHPLLHRSIATLLHELEQTTATTQS